MSCHFIVLIQAVPVHLQTLEGAMRGGCQMMASVRFSVASEVMRNGNAQSKYVIS